MMKWKTCFQISTSCLHNHFEEMKTFEDVFSVFLHNYSSKKLKLLVLPSPLGREGGGYYAQKAQRISTDFLTTNLSNLTSLFAAMYIRFRVVAFYQNCIICMEVYSCF